MKNSNYSTWQLWSLVILRVAIGWHLLYEGISKLLTPEWSSLGYLMDSKGLFEGLFHSIAGNAAVLNVIVFSECLGTHSNWDRFGCRPVLPIGSHLRDSFISLLLPFTSSNHRGFICFTK